MQKENIDINEVYKHYGMEKDLEAVKNKEIEGVDFLVGREEDLEKLTADMAGFGTKKSQRVIIDYEKGYGYFIVKRILTDQKVSEDTP